MARVFISYADESEVRRSEVWALAQRLRADGIDARIDQYVEGSPPYWPVWMKDEIRLADFVLCAVSKAYRERFESQVRMDKGKGVNWEALMMTEAMYADLPDAHRKFIPIGFSPGDLKNVPEVLLGAGRTAYLIPAAYDRLYERIAGTSPEPPALGDSPDPRRGPGAVNVRSRPPTAPDRFHDRTRESALLRESVLGRDGGCVLICGRPGMGKTALVSRLLQELEAKVVSEQIDFTYLTAAGPVPVSPDLLRTQIDQVAEPGASHPRARRTILALDRFELLLNADGTWRDDDIGSFITRAASDGDVHLLLLSRRIPAAPVLTSLACSRITVAEGLPAADAKELLLGLDQELALGLHRAADVIDDFLVQADGNPRALQLIAAALADDPLLDPRSLADDLSGVPDIAGPLLSESYDALDGDARAVVLVLSVTGGGMPFEILDAVGISAELEAVLRELLGRQLIRYDRVDRQVRLDPFDGRYLRKQLRSEELVEFNLRIAQAATSVVEGSVLDDLPTDHWIIAAVDHYLAAERPTEAAVVMDRFQRRLESRGIYDQIVRLRRRLMNLAGEKATNRTALIRILTLQGDFDAAWTIADQSVEFVRDGSIDGERDEWEIELAALERDSGDHASASRRFRSLAASAQDVELRARALIGAAQIARRQDELDRSAETLRAALELLADARSSGYASRQAEALALHQLGIDARFGRRRAEAQRLVNRATVASEAIGDRGGLAFRRCLSAALESDALSLSAATAGLHDALAIYGEIGDRWGASCSVAALASIEADRGAYSDALRMVATAEDLAQATNNTRVLGLLPEVRLRCERRSLRLRSQSRGLVVRARAYLSDGHFPMYARRLDLALLLHDLTMQSASPEEVWKVLAAELRPPGRMTREEEVIGAVLGLARPLAEPAPPRGGLPAGIAADLELALDG